MQPTFIQVTHPNKLFLVEQEKKSNVIAVMLAIAEKYNYEIKTKIYDNFIDNLIEVKYSNLSEQLELLKQVDEIVEVSSYSNSNSEIKVTRTNDNKDTLNNKIKSLEKRIYDFENPPIEKLYEKFVKSYSLLSDDEKRKLQLEIINGLVEGGL